MDWENLPALFPGFAPSEGWLETLRRHAEMLAEAAPAVRVSSVPSAEAVQRHYAESLELLRIFQTFYPTNFHGKSVADVGSGGGFPGTVLAALLPGAQVHLIEPLKKRARLLEQVASDLPLANVRVHPVRAEEAGRGHLRNAAALVTARAVASLPELIEYVAPLAERHGMIALPKGSRLEEELPAAAYAISQLACEVVAVVPMRPEVSEFGRVLLLRKVARTPLEYPRKPGIAGRTPLANPVFENPII